MATPVAQPGSPGTTAGQTPVESVAPEPELSTRPWLMLTVCCLAQFLMTLSIAIVNVALPSIQDALGFTVSDLQWVFNAYTITYAGFLLTGGRAVDHFGRRRVLVTGLALFAVSSLVGGLAGTQLVLVAARAAQGIAAAMVTPSTLAIIGGQFRDAKQRTRAFGTWGAMGGAGGAFGALAGGIVLEAASWHWVMFINTPIALVLAVGALLAITRDTRREEGLKLDLVGSVLVTSGIMVLVFGIVRSGSQGWDSVETIGGLVIGLVLLVAFVVYEGRFALAPLLPFRLFKSRSVVSANIIASAHSAAVFAMYYFLTLYLYDVLGASPRFIGVAYLPMAITSILLAQGSSELTRHFGPRATLMLSMTLMTIGLSWLARLSPESSYAVGILGPSMLIGSGQGIAMGATTIAGVSDVPVPDVGVAAGLINATRQIGGAIGLAVLATVANDRVTTLLAAGADTPDQIRLAYSSGYSLAFTIGAVITGIGFIAALSAPRRPG